MHIDHQREKLIQTVIFFAQNVRKLGKVKLFKLLYFVDFMHYKETGRSVTGMDYFAWQMGPVPVSFFHELNLPSHDWDGKVNFAEIPVANGHTMLKVIAVASFDPAHFSRREIRLLESLATEFRDADSAAMVEKTHLENSPWHKVWEQEGSKKAQIPYEYALRAQDHEAMSGVARDRAELLAAFAHT